jgi:hypothetical protein
MQMAQNKEEVFRNGAACALRRKKGRTYKQVDNVDDFTMYGLAWTGWSRF